MHDDRHDNIFDDDDALDFIIYEELGWEGRLFRYRCVVTLAGGRCDTSELEMK